MKSKQKLILLALFLWVCLFPPVVKAESEDLLSLYARAKTKDPTIGKAQARLDASRADSSISLSQLLPRIDVNAAINWINNETLYYGTDKITGLINNSGETPQQTSGRIIAMIREQMAAAGASSKA